MGPQSQHSGEMGTASAQEEIYHEDDTTETNTLTSEGTEVSSQECEVIIARKRGGVLT
jgi:hypothetical protein